MAAFRPRDFGHTSEQVYVEGLLDLDYDETLRAITWGIREGWTFMPALAAVRREARDDYYAPPFTRPALAEASVPADVVRLTERVSWRTRRAPEGEAEVARRRAEARAQAEAVNALQEAPQS